MMTRLRPAWLLLAVAVVACVNEPAAPWRVATPTIASVAVTLNPENALSATLSAHVRDADSVAVIYSLGEISSGRDSITPAVDATGDSATIRVLGLLPERRYVLRAIAYRNNRSTIGDDIEITTRQLPADLPHFSASGPGPLPGYVVFAAGMYGLVIDNTGRVVWYYRFQNGPGLNFMAEPNGHYVARPSTPNPSGSDPWLEIDPLGNVVRELRCASGFQSRPHDLIIDPEDGYWLMCDEVRTVDFSNVGGIATASVTGTAVQHLDKSGKLLFNWSAFDHFDVFDMDPADRKGTSVNWTHGNALDFDVDGKLLVSFRNLNEITKIDPISGAVVWRLGGKRNQFAFVNSTSPAFRGQHSVRFASGRGLMILDNLGTPGESRAELYTLDENSRTATLAHLYDSTPAVVTAIGGSVQWLPEGHTLVSFGTAGRVQEYDADGRVVWSIDGDAGYVFRAQRILSLYSPGVATAR